jgi:hypothetical protein
MAVAGLLLCLGLVPLSTAAQNALHHLSIDDVVKLLKGQVSPHRVAQRARQQGIDFEVTPEVEQELRRAGANDDLIAALHQLAPYPKPAQIVVQTSPEAGVYLDEQYVGRASSEGRLLIGNAKPGEHSLRVSLTGKKEFQGSITAQAGKESIAEARLEDVAGSVRVQTSGEVSGLIANVSDNTLILNVGTNAGIKVGDKLGIFRRGRTIWDPATGRVLKTFKTRLGDVTITEAEEFSSAGVFSGPAPPKVGDTVETVRP